VLLFEHRSLEPEFRRRHVPRRDRFEALWREVIQEGVNSGIFRDPDPALSAKVLLGTMNWTMTWYRPEGSLTMHVISAHMAQLFLNGLKV
jgi:hypothetical protein